MCCYYCFDYNIQKWGNDRKKILLKFTKLFSGDPAMLDRDVNSYCINNKTLRQKQTSFRDGVGLFF